MKKKTKIILSTLLILVGLGLLGTAGWLWYDANVDRSGWELLEDGSYSYRDFHGKSVTGWLSLEDRTCYFDDDYRFGRSRHRQQGNDLLRHRGESRYRAADHDGRTSACASR